jgi:multiple sugar transport system substrate-binding protein
LLRKKENHKEKTMRKLNRQLAVGMAGIAALVLAGCTPAATESPAPSGSEGSTSVEPIEIVWAIGGARSQPGGANALIADLWNEQNPDRQVRIEILPESADEAREQVSLVQQAEGSDFDILGLDVVWTGEYVENGWLENISDLRPELEAALLPGPLESASWAGDLWAVPLNTNTGLFYYRTDLVASAPTTWAEVCSISEGLSGQGIGGFAGQGAKYEGFVVNWLEMYFSAGGELYNEDQSESLFDVDKAVEVTDFVAGAIASGCFVPGYNTSKEEESRVAFQSGNAAFMRNWPGPVSLIEADTESPANGVTAVTGLPGFGGNKGISTTGGVNNAVSKFSLNKDAAKDFLFWAATDPGAQDILVQASTLPVLNSIYQNEPEGTLLSELGKALQTAKPRPSVPMWSSISLEIQDTIFPAVNGELDSRVAAERLAAYLEQTTAK